MNFGLLFVFGWVETCTLTQLKQARLVSSVQFLNLKLNHIMSLSQLK